MDEHTSHELAYRKGLEDGKPKWIPVAERLPKDGVSVLVYVYMNGEQIKATRKGNKWYSTWDNATQIVYVSHWMPLPEPPKGE